MDEDTKQCLIITLGLVLALLTVTVGFTTYYVKASEDRTEEVKIGMLNGYSEQFVPGIGMTWVKDETE